MTGDSEAFSWYVQRKREEYGSREINREEVDDLLLEVLDFVWLKLSSAERASIEAAGPSQQWGE